MEPSRAPYLTLARGFTLVEMLVVLSIIVIVTAITLTSQSTFNRSLLLTNTAYAVALSVREMQSLGLSSRRFTGAGQDVQNPGYGVHFQTGLGNSFILFADTSNTPGPIPSTCEIGVAGTPEGKPGNCLYDTDATPDGIVQTYSFSRGFTISDFCGRPSANSPKQCASTGAFDALDIVFTRSATESAITGRLNSNQTQLVSGEVVIRAPDADIYRYVCISRVGQVSVANASCP
jgi:prepilin-type N-terminal cleavage/methylation domain-containing protein